MPALKQRIERLEKQGGDEIIDFLGWKITSRQLKEISMRLTGAALQVAHDPVDDVNVGRRRP